MREIRIVVRILLQDMRPALAHDRFATGINLIAYRCVPIKLRKRSVDDQITCPPHFETKIDVCKSLGEGLVKSADLLKNFSPHQHARAGDGAIIAGHPQLTVHARMLRWETAKRGLRNSIDAKNEPGVLDCSVRVDQSRTDCANFRPLDLLGHNRQPIALNWFEAS